ncbi:type I restriction endonuclease [Pontibacter cellulosilyticus]|uniref:Type I restriction enzyme HsdR N-terminal domain-containing protein n=1 Tax=Pontibacter cellulosilyticus TaxID=1720253 RepID=A0A923SJG6_9BACT|nr:type I restriction endonuclease [Pontibacter cellulosilyticus]MBC5992711.1 type I restriction enzyme HsdR N-terminal domain-containing protein [Pontibacter cellulosilyticus]
MDFIDVIKALAEKVSRMKETIQTEEATKTAFVMPFIAALGYDVFNPLEVIPEFIADLGIKKGEKVDYCIQKEGQPIIIVECKHWKEELNVHNSQLHRYFHVCSTRFGILTNGIIYRFYTDLEEPNKMDNKPFWEFDITDMSEAAIAELKKYQKKTFDVDQILSAATELKYTREIKKLLASEFNVPSEHFVRLFAKQIYSGPVTAKVMEQFTPMVKKSIQQHISDLISDRLKSALSNETEAAKKEQEQALENVVAATEAVKVEFTEIEQEGYYIIKSILRVKIDAARLSYRDTTRYLNILLDDTIRKTVCRLHLNGTKKYIGLMDEEGKETRFEIENIDDIYRYTDQLLKTVMRFEGKVEPQEI